MRRSSEWLEEDILYKQVGEHRFLYDLATAMQSRRLKNAILLHSDANNPEKAREDRENDGKAYRAPGID